MRKMVQIEPETYEKLLHKKHEYEKLEKRPLSFDGTIKRLLQEDGGEKQKTTKKEEKHNDNTMCKMQKNDEGENPSSMVLPRLLSEKTKKTTTGTCKKKCEGVEDGIHKNIKRGLFQQ